MDKEAHTRMLLDISREIPAESEEFRNLKSRIQATNKVSRSEISTKNNAQDLMEAAVRRGVFLVGDNSKLREMLTAIHLVDAVKIIDEAEAKAGIRPGNPATQDPTAPLMPDSNLVNKPGAATEEFLDIHPRDGRRRPLRYFDENKKLKGFVYIINNFTKDRQGSEEDVNKLKDFFHGKLDFQVNVEQDLQKNDILENLTYLQKTIEKGFIPCDVFILVAMSHGGEVGIKTCKPNGDAEEEQVKIEEMVEILKADRLPRLAGKPKIFLVQSCRGEDDMQGMDVADDKPQIPVPVESADAVPPVTYSAPVEADILVAYATSKGYRSYRRDTGSWFITDMMGVFQECYTYLPLMSMLTMVNYEVSRRRGKLTDAPATDPANLKQMPCIVSTLTKELYFK